MKSCMSNNALLMVFTLVGGVDAFQVSPSLLYYSHHHNNLRQFTVSSSSSSSSTSQSSSVLYMAEKGERINNDEDTSINNGLDSTTSTDTQDEKEDYDSVIEVESLAAADEIENDDSTSTSTTTTPEPALPDTRLLRSQLKNSLLLTAASSDRGQLASVTQRDEVSSLITQLTDMDNNNNIDTTTTAVGTWELVYCSTQLFRSSPFFMAGRAVCETSDQAKQYDWFCDMHRAALAISNIGKVRQIISETQLTSEFEVKVGAIPFLSDFTPFRYSGGLPLTIDGTIVSTASIDTQTSTSYTLYMDTVEIKGSNIPILRQLLPNLSLRSRGLGDLLESNMKSYSNPKPIFRSVYLDGEMRISMDQDDNVFVYAKTSDGTDVTDYEGTTMGDLGVTKLLEGFNDAVSKVYL